MSNSGEKCGRLYRYQPVTPHTLASLVQARLHLSSPRSYNDPYDCRTADPVRTLSASDLRAFVWKYGVDHFFELTGIGINAVNEYDKAPDESVLLCEYRKILRKERRDVISALRLCCFSELKNDITLWSHYGAQHTGVCLEFDRAKHPFANARKVEYVDDLPEFDFVNGYLTKDYAGLVEAQFKKHKGWKYEEEWRIATYESADTLSYDYDSLTAVFLGARMDETIEELVVDIVAEFPERPRCVRLEMDERMYRLDEKELKLYGNVDAFVDDVATSSEGL